MTIGGRWLSVSVAAACFTMPAPAQTPFVSGGASVVGIHSQGVTSGVATRTSGTMLGGVATARFGRADVEGRYIQGALQGRDFVQGQLGVGFHPAPWVEAHAAVRARAYITPTETERWVTWLLGVRVESGLVSTRGSTVRGDVGLWRALALSANVGSTDGQAGRGGEAGVTLQTSDRPWWFRVSYGIDRSAVAGASRRETVEEFTLTVGIRRR